MAVTSKKGKYRTPEGSRNWEYLASLFCSIQFLCVGCIVGWNSPSIAKLMAKDSEISITASDASTMTALISLGHMLAYPLVGIFLHRIGPKYTILVSGIPLALNWTMIIFARSAMVLCIARFIAGLSLSFASFACPLYIGEISSTKSRGTTGAALGITFNLGILMAFFVGPYLSVRAMATLCLGVVIVFILCFWFAPESPHFLAMVGKVEEAEEMLEKLRGKNDVSEEMEVIVKSLSTKDSAEGIELGSKEEGRKIGSDKTTSNERHPFLVQLFEVVTVQANRRAFIVMVIFSASHQFGGYSILMSYGQLIFRKMESPMPEHVAPMAIGLVQLFSSVAMTFVVDRLGRRPMILVSGILCALSNAAIGFYFYANEYLGIDVTKYSMIPLVASMIFFFAFNCGFLGPQGIIMSEIFATRVKALASCIVGILSGVIGTVTLKMYLMIAITWGTGHSIPFVGFAIFLVAATVIILYILPETKGKTFVEIQEELSK